MTWLIAADALVFPRDCCWWLCVPGRVAVVLLHRVGGSEAQIEPRLAPSPDLVVELTSTLVAGAGAEARLGRLGDGEACKCSEGANWPCRVQWKLNSSTAVAKGPHAFQEQNWHGWLREMSSPIMFPPVATSHAPLTWAQSIKGSLIAPTGQSLDAATFLSAHHVGMHIMISRASCRISCNLLFLPSARFRRDSTVFATKCQPQANAVSLTRHQPSCWPWA